MGHGITENDSMVSGNNIVPWHKLGRVVAGLMTASDCIQKAGLNWEVKSEPLFDQDGKEIPGYFGNIRQDVRSCLGVVKGRYQVINNLDLFDFFDTVVSQGEAVYETAGSLYGGKVVWMLCKLNQDMMVRGDAIKNYAMLFTSHDGTKPLVAKLCNVRVVCQNTLSAAIGEATNEIRIRHTKNYEAKASEAQKVLGIAQAHSSLMARTLEKFALRKLDPKAAEKFVESLFPGEGTRVENTREEVIHLFRAGKGNEGKTVYDMLNGVTEYVDHSRSSRVHGDKNADEVRFDSVLLGTGDKLKSRAFDMLAALVA